MTSATTIRVVDDDDAVRRSLTRLLKLAGYQVAPFSGVDAFLNGDDPSVPGCLIVDVQMPQRDGFELVECLAEQQNRIPIIMLTAHGDVPMAVNAMQRGAFDFLEKPFDKGHLLKRIEQALARDLANREQDRACRELRDRLELLTPCEQEVLELLLDGLAVKQIASQLGKAHHTVKHQRASILRKLQADSEVTLMRMLAPIRGASASPPHDGRRH